MRAGSRAAVSGRHQFPAMADNKLNQNEGEGSKSADKKYREAATDSARRTDTIQAGQEAARELERNRDELEKAEKAGRAHSKGDVKEDLTGEDFDRKE